MKKCDGLQGKLAHLCINYAKWEIVKRIKDGTPPPGYTVQELQTVLTFLKEK